MRQLKVWILEMKQCWYHCMNEDPEVKKLVQVIQEFGFAHEESEVLVVSLRKDELEIFRDPLLGPNLSS